MRINLPDNTPLMPGFVEHEHGRELEMMDRILTGNIEILELVRADLEKTCTDPGTGRLGMTAEQVLRVLVVKQMRMFSYRQLEFALLDSQCYRSFCRIGHLTEPPTKSALNSNIKQLSAETIEKINRIVLGVAEDLKVENGRKIRVDAMAVDSNIHHPTDSSLLWDSVRVLSRLMKRAQVRFGVSGVSRARRAKRRLLQIANTKKAADQIEPYRDMIKTTREAIEASRKTVEDLRNVRPPDIRLAVKATLLGHGWQISA